MNVIVRAYTTKGNVRQNNEDSLLVSQTLVNGQAEFEVVETHLNSDGLLIAVADGMGGHEQGEVASRIALEAVGARLGSGDGIEPSVIEATVLAAHQQVVAAATAGLSAIPGTTLTGIVATGTDAWFFHVGDSRLYTLKGGYLRQLTNDHTAQSLGIEVSRNALINSIGGRAQPPFVDVLPLSAQWVPGARFMLCSDGVYDSMEVDAIEDFLAAHFQDEEAARNLCDLAIAAGSDDNCSVILVELP